MVTKLDTTPQLDGLRLGTVPGLRQFLANKSP